MRVLVVEDDPRMAGLLRRALRESGYAVDVVGDGNEAAEQASFGTYDLMILDILLPGLDGFAVCRALRAVNATMPILMLSARSEIADRVRGLEEGADDYLPKPFAVEELRARVGALLRRRSLPTQITLKVGDIRLDRGMRSVQVRGRTVELTGKEYSLLEYILLNRGRVVTRREIAEHVWDEHFDPFSNLIEVYVGRLRQKIDAMARPGEASFLTTRRGEGYFVEDLREAGG
ncbi:MAG TPA: response regulator transcription factor [Thermoanaerobaculia bacterium]|nr:response regulator transcription factor [Thermoanaerobaculia bacterium]